MKTYRLANAEKLLKEIRTFIDDNMGWITEGEKQDPNLFIFSNEMRVVRDKIQKYLMKTRFRKLLETVQKMSGIILDNPLTEEETAMLLLEMFRRKQLNWRKL